VVAASVSQIIVMLMTAALHPKDHQQLPTDLPKRASYPPAYPEQANAPATKRG
jgi:hypothetical protein